jgi:hypothetical protein
MCVTYMYVCASMFINLFLSHIIICCVYVISIDSNASAWTVATKRTAQDARRGEFVKVSV